jgi:hypothetical protein
MDVFKQIFDWLGNALNQVLSWVLFMLPDSPFKLLSNSPISQYLPYINYFIDVATILDILVAWITCIGIYYGYQVILRWIKAIN